ncbi:hypothetical protein C8Q80DRAFT_1256709 [Daedaleopsis nitida]|nr:hypothetical protein C8Q80DRAFT_1256709 [Daedaleopsis nitida]
MHTVYVALVSLLFSQVAFCAPAGSLDADVFLQNGKDAQALNAEFATLKASDTCDDGEMACIKDSIAHCANATWKLEACPKTLSCFALPSVREEGTVISCTSNATALSVINASGATGGIAANSTTNSVNLPSDCDGDDESDDDNSTQSASTASGTASATSTRSHESTHTASASDSESATAPSSTSSGKSGNGNDNGKDSQATVTVTVIPTATLPSETFTLDPSDASSLLSSLATEPGVSITTIRHSVPTTSSVSADATEGTAAASSKPKATASPSSSVPAISVGPPLTITLLGLGQPAGPTSTTAASSADGYSY